MRLLGSLKKLATILSNPIQHIFLFTPPPPPPNQLLTINLYYTKWKSKRSSFLLITVYISPLMHYSPVKYGLQSIYLTDELPSTTDNLINSLFSFPILLLILLLPHYIPHTLTKRERETERKRGRSTGIVVALISRALECS